MDNFTLCKYSFQIRKLSSCVVHGENDHVFRSFQMFLKKIGKLQKNGTSHDAQRRIRENINRIIAQQTPCIRNGRE